MIRNQDFNLQAGASVPINVEGNYVYFDSATGADQRLRVTSGSGGADVILRPGMDMELPEMQSVLYVQNVGATVLSGILIVGVGKVTNRLLSGSVEVNNLPATQTTQRTKEAAARAGRSYAVALGLFPEAGKYGYAALRNPVGGAKKVYVDRLKAQTTVGGGANSYVEFLKYEYTGAPGSWLTVPSIGDAAIASLASAVVNQWTDSTTLPGALVGGSGMIPVGYSAIDLKYNASADDLEREYAGGLVLEPGQLVLVVVANQGAATAAGAVTFEWWEE